MLFNYFESLVEKVELITCIQLLSLVVLYKFNSWSTFSSVAATLDLKSNHFFSALISKHPLQFTDTAMCVCTCTVNKLDYAGKQACIKKVKDIKVKWWLYFLKFLCHWFALLRLSLTVTVVSPLHVVLPLQTTLRKRYYRRRDGKRWAASYDIEYGESLTTGLLALGYKLNSEY